MGDTATTPEAMIDEYCERVHRFAAMVSRGDQDSSDLAQEALARALRRCPSLASLSPETPVSSRT